MQLYNIIYDIVEVMIEAVWLVSLNNSFQYLDNITRIFTLFFTYTYFQKIQIMLLEQHYQTDPNNWTRVIIWIDLMQLDIELNPHPFSTKL